MASKAQRAVTGVSHERWGQLGKALQDWREDVLGYEVRSYFADDRDINLRLVQDLEKNYRPGTYTKWALQDAARAYEVPYCPDPPEGERRTLPAFLYGPGSILAFLRGEVDALGRAEPAEPEPEVKAEPLPEPEVKGEWQPPITEPGRRAADWPYAERIYEALLQLRDRGITDPSGDQLIAEISAMAKDGQPGTRQLPPPSPLDAKVWDGTAGRRLETRERVWLVADMQRRAEGRDGGRSAPSASGTLRRGNIAGERPRARRG